jgi:hypothetical protein
MESGHNFPGVDVDFWTMHNVILKPSSSSLYFQGFHNNYVYFLLLLNRTKKGVTSLTIKIGVTKNKYTEIVYTVCLIFY